MARRNLGIALRTAALAALVAPGCTGRIGAPEEHGSGGAGSAGVARSEASSSASSSSAAGGGGGAGSGVGGASGGGASGGGGGAPMVVRCGPNGADELTDPFDGNALGAQWDSWVNGGAFVIVSGGQLILRLPDQTAADTYAGIWSKATYNMIDCQVFTNASKMPDPNTEAYMCMTAEASSGNNLEICAWHGSLQAKKAVAHTSSVIAAMPYDPASQAFWRLRESAGISYWEISPDGTRWTTMASQPDPVPLDAITFKLGGGTYKVEASPPGEARFDNVNLRP